MISYISTREVASLLNVTETTIKRWTESGQLKCAKTLGGHRKYILQDVEDFAKEHNMPLSGQTTSLKKEQMEKLGYAVFSKNMEIAAGLVVESALRGNREEMFELLMYLIKNRMKFVDIVDTVIQPALAKVGNLWENKKLDVEQEHIASDTIKTALARVVIYLPRQKTNNIKIVCACIEGEYHDIAIQSLAYEFELSGYSLHYTGANTPFKSLAKAVERVKPDFVLLSATSPSVTKSEIIKGIKLIREKGKNCKLVAGGSYFQHFNEDILNCDIIVNSLKETVSFIKQSIKKK